MKKDRPFLLLKNIHDKFEARGNIECQKVGLTISHFRTLLYLTEHADSVVTQREMELEFKVSHPTINGILTRMEEKGFVTTEIVKQGKQQRLVHITEKGKNAVEQMNVSRHDDIIGFSTLFSPTELSQLEDYLHRILDYIS